MRVAFGPRAGLGTCQFALTLTLSMEEPVAFSAGAGVSARSVDAHLSVVTLMGVRLAFVDVCRRRKVDVRRRKPTNEEEKVGKCVKSYFKEKV